VALCFVGLLNIEELASTENSMAYLSLSMPRIAIIGYGVVGQAVGAVLAAKVKDAKVSVFDSQQKSQAIGRVRVISSFKAAVEEADYVFLCVSSHLEGKGIDGQGWKRLAALITKQAKPDAVVVIKSTLVPGDAARLEKLTKRRVVVCPEFMAEGTAERDILKPHRVLVGGQDKDAVDSVIRLYRHWVPAARIIRMDAWSAQLAKLFANAMLAQRVSSINSMASLCELAGGDVRAVSKAAGMDPRIGSLYLQTSVGFGGSCLEKDVRLLCTLAQCMGLPEVARYWHAVIGQNDAQVRRVTRQISKMAGKGGRVAVLGLAFKPGVADVRNSAPLRIAEGLAELGHPVVAHDPKVKAVKGVSMASTPSVAVRDAAVVVVLNDEPVYRALDWRQIARIAAPGAKVYACSSVLGREAATELETTILGGTT
jgi:UDPglucose 6-dehydrogenase